MTALLRDVTIEDLLIFYEQQRDPDAAAMADFPTREYEPYMAHWRKNVLGNPQVIVKTIMFEGQVAGNILSFERAGRRYVGYWLGKAFWGKGIASQALADLLPLIPTRPLYADIAKHNLASQRVLEKNGFLLHGEEEGGLLFKLA